MNYYERHLGDYAKDTGHLSILEHGVYTLLLDRYYSTEAPIPADQVYRLARARSDDEKNAVDVVLTEFFELVDGAWRNTRADEEIIKAAVRIDAAKANGSKGGRPKKNPMGSENETQQKPTGFSVGSENETQQKAHHTPHTKPHTPPKTVDNTHGSGDGTDTAREGPPRSVCAGPPDIGQPTPAGAVCGAIRAMGIPDANPSHPTLLALIEAGATPEEFAGAASESIRKGKPSFAYVVGIVKRRREEAAKLVLHQGRLPNPQEAIEQANRATANSWKPPELREKTA